MKTNFVIQLSFLGLVLCSCVSTKSAQEQSKEVVHYMNTILAKDLKKHLTIIASDSLEGRNTGEIGQKKAAEYLKNFYINQDIPYPTGAESYYQSIPSEFFHKAFSPKLGDSENVWAFIEGNEKPEEIVVISAHYDHVGMKNNEVYNGADDNGSGTSSLLEMAEAFALAKKGGHGPKRSILFLHVTGEEHGLHGSRYYTENPLFPLKNTIVDLNIDMVGRRDSVHANTNNYVYLIGSDRLSTDLHNISEEANEKYVQLELDYTYNALDDPNRFYYRSDHYNFAKNGIPSLFYFNGVHDDYHQPTDDVDKIEFDALEKRVRLFFVTAWELANREERPVVDKEGK
ncbi:MAG: M28 family peptidase [Flavobacteriales bacterium]|nr:M28 family peptidase [Flavobacteriales bacterium]